MKLIKASQADKHKMDIFLEHNQTLKKNILMLHGYVVEIAGQFEGCFVLEPVNENTFWLKQLNVTKKGAPQLPVLFESILVMAKELGAEHVYVHSHQPMVDVLLQSLQFHPQQESEFVDNHPVEKGNWWTYCVS